MREQFEDLCVEIILVGDDIITTSVTTFGVSSVGGCGYTENEVGEQDILG